MKIVQKAADILDSIEKGFASRYKPQSTIITEDGMLWKLIKKTVIDSELMNHIIFCNDVLKMPPVRVFLLIHAEQLEGEELKDTEKQALGAVFGYIFKDFLKYKKQRSVSCRVNGCKTATYFLDMKSQFSQFKNPRYVFE